MSLHIMNVLIKYPEWLLFSPTVCTPYLSLHTALQYNDYYYILLSKYIGGLTTNDEQISMGFELEAL